ncbi:MAG TPA: hypothetical protein VMT73_14735 [Anaerolineales bacterium]|nr:hypothetical protein [Anaerolineales bacterium]
MTKFASLTQIMKKWFASPWYPFVFALYPVLALLAANVGQVEVSAGARPLLISIAGAGTLFLLLRLLLRDWHRAAFLSTLLLALFFSYGHVYNLLIVQFPKINFTPWLLASWGVLALLFIWWATRPKLNFATSAVALNVIALGLVITSLTQIGFDVEKEPVDPLPAQNAPAETLTLPQNPPDVYYFILDMYTRADLMKSAYDYDNSGFVNELQKRGFYVASCSQSNYTRTELSVASSLNMSYLQDLDSQFDDVKSTARLHLWDTLKHSTVRYNLEQLGYKTISYANGYAWSELSDTDVFLTPPPFSSGMTEFEALFLQTTLAREAQDVGWLDADQIAGQNYRDRDMLVFNSMKKVANMSGPKFVYVHLILPHPPFVFGPDGTYTNPADFWNEQKLYPADKFEVGYTNQVTFLNKKLLETVDTILSESKNPPIIILQGDHGPWLQPNPQHFFILNAYYLPGYTDKLYPNISPVNSFRLVFDSYFGGKYDMLKDQTYFSPVPDVYNFSEVSNPCK